MTKDLRNTYHDLFRYLRKELPADEAEQFLSEAEAQPEVAENLANFRAAKVLIEEKELLDFKQQAQGYAKQQARNKVIKKVAAGAIVTAALGYLFFSTGQSNEEITPQTTPEAPSIEEVNTPAPIDTPFIEKEKQVETPTPINNNVETNKESKPETKSTPQAAPKQENPESKKVTPPKETKEEAPIVKKESPAKIKRIEAQNSPTSTVSKDDLKALPLQESQIEMTVENIEEPQAPETFEADKGHCDIYVPETFAPGFDRPFTLTTATTTEGVMTIYNEFMQEVYKEAFSAESILEWDGNNTNSEAARMGPHKIILQYNDGTQCVKNITILRR